GVLDLEQLSVINYSFGRHAGDLLLEHVADRLRQRIGNTELLAQLGGGTFAIVLDVAPGEDLPAVLAAHLDALFQQPFVIDGRTIPVLARSGLAVYPTDGVDANSLLENAELALREAKESGTRHRLYSAAHTTAVVARLALEHKLRKALRQQQFELHYQPKISARDQRIAGAEALIRWRDPDTGLVPPAVFLPVLESSGLIEEVGEWIVEQAVTDTEYLRLEVPDFRVAVNVSPLQFRRADFSERFLRLMRAATTTGMIIDMEITEGMLGSDAHAEIRKLQTLRAAGVRIAIDDFGTGYSSLSRLAELPIDTLKIDRSFVSRLPRDTQGRTLVATVIRLAQAFEMTTIAEGVETREQFAVLRDMQCDELQGYLISRPVPCAALVAWLRRLRSGAVTSAAG
ncbi:MAG TPA: bifunctional diguanylate cyclase/phosphodiesterase, partial [Steroidobacter sp.]|nr:bifunctional diguanylate cyclase/phosphodiesterase [Steroidobacter sp.]